MKNICKNCRNLNQALASLAVIAAIVCLPSLHYSRAHLHYFYGVAIAHWHPGNGLSPEQAGKKTPVAEHNHALSDLFNLWNIEKHQGTPVDLAEAQIFLVEQYSIPVTDSFLAGLDSQCSPSGRSPPALQA